MGKGTPISPFLASIIIAVVVIVVLIVGWKAVGPRGKAEMTPEQRANMEKALGVPHSGSQIDSTHAGNHS